MAEIEHEEHNEAQAGPVDGHVSDTPSESIERHESNAPETEGGSEKETTSGDVVSDLEAETGIVAEISSPTADTNPGERSASANGTTPTPLVKASVSPKTAGSAPSTLATPTVKKVLKSGTFGASTTKPPSPSSSKATTSAKPTTSASPLRKSTSATTTAPTKATMPPPSRQATTAPPPLRRTSLAPRAVTSTVPTSSKPALASGTGTKPPTAATSTTVRPSVTSPDSAASLKSSTSARPRPPANDGARRSSVVPSPAPNRPSSTASVRPGTRTAGSVTSVKEVKGDSNALEDLKNKLAETSASLLAKSDLVTNLENQVHTLTSSLDTAMSDVTAKGSALEELTERNGHAEAQLAELTQLATVLKSENDDCHASLQALQKELQVSQNATTSQAEFVQTLQAKIRHLEVEVGVSAEELRAMRSSATKSAAADREALARAQDNLTSLHSEIERLRSDHANTLQEAMNQVAILEAGVACASTLQAQLADVQKENEEKATKVSELEIEILEMKEDQEASEDAREKSNARIASLEDEVTKLHAALQEADETAKAMVAEFSHTTEAASSAHSSELQVARSECEALSSRLATLEEEATVASAAHNQTKTEAAAAAESHQTQLRDLEARHLAKQAELAEQISILSSELEKQESKYNAKVDAVKAEHEDRLKEAFESAKNEAGAIHSQDLQTLRAESHSTTEQLQSAHQSTIDSLKAEYDQATRIQVSGLEKQLANQHLDLRATQDDLTKSKATVTSLSSELESVKSQLEGARQLVSALDKSDKDEIIAQLTKDLSNIHEEHAALKDMFVATNESLREITNNHTTELEEAAKSRAEEMMKLRASHDEEMAALTNDRIALTTRLSDLEGELATAKAALLRDPLTPSRSNGAAHVRSPSVSKEELTRLHEAHNLKVNDLQAEHDRAMRLLREEVEVALSKADQLNQELTRKTMEIQYLEQDQEESQDQITRMKADLDQLSEQLKTSKLTS